MTPNSLSDFWVIYRLQRQGTHFDLKGSLLYPASPMYHATARSLPSFGLWPGRVLTVVHREQGKAGFLQARWRSKWPVLDLLFIAPALGVPPGTAWLWFSLVQELVHLSAEHNAQRIFAQLPDNRHAETEIMRQSGFSTYGQDRVYCLETLPSFTESQESFWRERAQIDDWGLTRLYSFLTPPVVQQAESMNHNGDHRYVGWWSSPRHQEYVLRGATEGEVHGYLSLTRGEDAHWLKLVLHPGRADQSTLLLEQALAMIRHWPARPIYCDVRDYEGYITGVLERAGFEHLMTRMLLVRHITNYVRVKRPISRTILDVAPEAAPNPLLNPFRIISPTCKRLGNGDK